MGDGDCLPQRADASLSRTPPSEGSRWATAGLSVLSLSPATRIFVALEIRGQATQFPNWLNENDFRTMMAGFSPAIN